MHLFKYVILVFCFFLSELKSNEMENHITNLLQLRKSVIERSNSIDALHLYSHERSGTHFVMGIIAYLTNRRIDFPYSYYKEKRILPNLVNIPVDDLQPPCYLYHNSFGEHQYINKEKNKLILVLRNYKECFLRHFSKYTSVLLRFRHDRKNILDNNQATYYFKNIEAYDSFSPQNRFLICYEDLISNPKKVIFDLANFLNSSPEKASELWNNFDQFKADQLYLYRHFGGSRSKGKSTIFHSKNIEIKKLQKLDTIIKRNYPRYWELYLSRYES